MTRSLQDGARAVERWLDPRERRSVSSRTLLLLVLLMPIVYLAILFLMFGSDVALE